METPNTEAGRLTEEIMQEIVRNWKPQGKIPVETYNSIYSAVLRTLEAQ